MNGIEETWQAGLPVGGEVVQSWQSVSARTGHFCRVDELPTLKSQQSALTSFIYRLY